MDGLEDDDGPEESEAPDVADVVEELGLNERRGSDEPVEGRERRGGVIFRDRGGGVGGSGHYCAGRRGVETGLDEADNWSLLICGKLNSDEMSGAHPSRRKAFAVCVERSLKLEEGTRDWKGELAGEAVE